MILGIDIGYGDVKTIISDGGKITHQFKFSSAIARAAKISAIRDSRVVSVTSPEGEEFNVYCGVDALSMPTEDIIDISDYDLLELYAPVFIYQALKTAGLSPEDVKVVVSGLSVSQLSQSGYFKERIKNFKVWGVEYNFDKVFLLPQGAGSKMAFDKYDIHYPKPRAQTNNYTFVGCDIGFNTLDLYFVTDGKTSPNLFEGIPQEGVMRIADIIRTSIKETYQKDLSLREAKQVLDTGVYKLRGTKYDMSEVIAKAKQTYITRLQEIIESRYGKILDKCDFICIQGGGATFFVGIEDPFIKVIHSYPEFYNAIGFCLYGELMNASAESNE